MDPEKKQVMDMLYEYKDAFSLRDEIGICLNKEVEIDITDKPPFSIRPYHVKEEDKEYIGQGDEKIVLSRYIKVTLICRMVTKEKRVVTNFRHLNVTIAKNSLAYPLLKDRFSMLGSFRCKVLSVLDLKDVFHSLRLSENSKRYCGILPYFGSTLYLYQRMPVGLNISPSICQSYLNTILDCLQCRKYCKAIMDDLLLFMPMKKSHIAKLEDLLKALPKMDSRCH